jgi:SPP1 family predicted phage head-tail adaptor
MPTMADDLVIKSGDLRHRVQIQTPIDIQNNLGEIIEDPDSVGWSTVATIWAAIEPMTGNEFWAAGRYEHEVDTTIRIRYRSGLNNTMQIIWTDSAGQTHTYHIHGIIDIDQRHIQIRLICKEVV